MGGGPPLLSEANSLGKKCNCVYTVCGSQIADLKQGIIVGGSESRTIEMAVQTLAPPLPLVTPPALSEMHIAPLVS